jgi:MoxR-like ATPase
MNDSFRLLNADSNEPVANRQLLQQRTISNFTSSFADDARNFVADKLLETAINTAIAVGAPLLITGEPGTGKTQAAYYAAYKLGIEPVLHFQVKSDSSAKDLLYHFDTVRYFHDAHLLTEQKLNKRDYIEERDLWLAIQADETRVLLIDEIDKAPRDFPNDLLHELDKMEFKIAETGEIIRADHRKRPIVFITSNSERRLPEPFLRRCVYHHIVFTQDLLEKAVAKRKIKEYAALSEDFIKLAVNRFLDLRNSNLRKKPSTAEFLMWLRVLGLTVTDYSEKLDSDLSKLPFLGALIKDHQDLDDLQRKR